MFTLASTWYLGSKHDLSPDLKGWLPNPSLQPHPPLLCFFVGRKRLWPNKKAHLWVCNLQQHVSRNSEFFPESQPTWPFS